MKDELSKELFRKGQMHKYPQIVCLHGLGGSPRSAKGLLIKERFKQHGIATELLSVSIPSLEKLSVVLAIQAVAEELRSRASEPVVLIGSSFGAFVAIHALASLTPQEKGRVERLVLLAPLFDPWDQNSALLTPEVQRSWREVGTFPIMDLELKQEVPVHYRLMEELRLFDSSKVSLNIPTLIVHGTQDKTVPCSQSQHFAAERGEVQLKLVDQGHQLLEDPQGLLLMLEEFILHPLGSS